MSKEPDSIVYKEPLPESLAEIPPLSEHARQIRPRGYYALRSRNPSNTAKIDEDLQAIFPTERIVNEALRVYLSGSEAIQPIAAIKDGAVSLEERQSLPDFDTPLPVVVIHKDLHPFFPTAAAVNRALRAVAELVHQVEARRAS